MRHYTQLDFEIGSHSCLPTPALNLDSPISASLVAGIARVLLYPQP
jgi:hypothetical protein